VTYLQLNGKQESRNVKTRFGTNFM
jgi:hypothetical protein